ncbi:MAG: DNA polymerase IV [Planctomycetales bacterium]|nr:DNA polymerase IV [Planctomycetales bacterium]
MGSGTWPRIVAHADMDAFYAAVEQLDDPRLRGKPVIVGGPSRRGVVSTASYEARPFGVHSAMPTAQARKLCPDGIFVPPRFDRYVEVSRVVMETFGRFTPTVEPLSLDEAFLDMTGAERLFGPPEAMGTKIRAAVREATRGLTVSVGVAPTKFLAKLASDFRKPDGLTVVRPDEVAAFLDPLPISRIFGVGPKTAPRLERMGLRTIGDAARLPEATLVARLGSLGEHVSRLARGLDPREVVGDREGKSVSSEQTLDQDIVGERAIRPWLRRSADDVARRLRAEGILASGVRVKLKTAGFRILTRQCALPRPTDTAADLLGAADALLPEFDLAVPTRLVGLGAFRLAPAGAAEQRELFGEESREKRRRLDKSLDAANARFGRGSIRRASDVD